MSEAQVFQADSLPAALAQVKQAFGADAVILGTRTVEAQGIAGLVKKSRVEITAAPPHHPHAPRASNAPRPTHAPRRPPTAPPDSAATSPTLARSYYDKLVAQEVADELARQLLDELTGEQRPLLRDPQAAAGWLRGRLADMIPTCAGIQLSRGATRTVCFVGPPGAGKTTTLAKLAAHFRLRESAQVELITTDVHRLAAAEQLHRYGELIGVPVHSADTIEAISETTRRLRSAGAQLILIDTPGLGPREAARRARLHALIRAARPCETHLVLPATLNSSVQERYRAFFEPFAARRAVLTHLDEAVGLGVVVNAMQRLRFELSYVSTGQCVPRDFEVACGRRIADLIVDADAAPAA